MTTTTMVLKHPILASVCLAALLLTHCVHVDALVFNEPVAGGGGGSGSGVNVGAVGINYLDVSAMTKTDCKAILCDGLPRPINDCEGMLPWVDYYSQNWQRLTKKSQAGRKRRFADWSGSNADWFSSNPSWSVTPSWSSWSWGSSGSQQPSGPSFTCPPQTNQSAVYQLSSAFKEYPIEAVATELGRNLVFFEFLLKEAVVSKKPPIVLVDEFLKTAPSTCPSSQQRLWHYYSFTQNQRCWVLANFGDPVLYTRCNTSFCKNCSPSTVSGTSGTQGSSWGWFSSSSWGWPSNNNNNNNNPSPTANKCITEYRATSFWAYCPAKSQGQRIVRDRIIIPQACSCRTVTCTPVPGH
ncbi:uncharacterized protein LOC143284294 [Babylonia areolata]|uniref:uncharacterized protein LOC143284294 n=1 Tax=Babylonia areolata TaxID=304850 RepID=UPI003FD35377